MKCVICKLGETEPGLVTVTLERGETVVIVKQVPARVCRDCGEYYLGETEAARVLSLAESAFAKQAEIEVLRYAA
jgi:YgiT-type zinc finger domain-containing protein